MNILKKVVLFFIFFVIFFSQSFALVLEGNIVLNKTTSNSLDLSWQPVDGALGYFVYYDTVSHSDDKGYSYSVDDMIEGTGVILDNLSPNTEYYVALRVVDEEGNEGDFSKEFVFSTEVEENNNLFIEDIKILSKNKIVVTFNVNIDPNKDKEFKIENKENNVENIPIDNIIVNGRHVELDLLTDLRPDEIYTLTVISLTGIDGETIKTGVDGVSEFYTGDLKELEGNTEITERDTEATNNFTNTGVELNSAGINEKFTKVLGGENLNSNDVKKIVKTKKLPQTGPAEWLLLIFALGLAFVIIRFKKA